MKLKQIGIVFILAQWAAGAAWASGNALGHTPYRGWSSWSLEATKYPGYGGEGWLTAAHVEAQSMALHRLLQSHGYTRMNIDSGWQKGYDAYGRPIPDPQKFPGGIAAVARFVHHNGQKLGIYWIPGINQDLYQLNPPILGTPYHIQDIVYQPTRPATGWGFGDKIDYSKPGAQAYINSVATLFASWGVDFLKLDGVTPGSGHNDLSIDARPDVQAWAAAIKQTKRPIWLELSWNLDHDYAPFWEQYAQGRRITDDVESYGPTLTGWPQITWRFNAARTWAADAGPGKGWNDLDSLDVGNGAMDGLTRDEREAAVTLWAISCAPLYSGDDLTKLTPHGVALLTNDRVLAIDRAGRPAQPVSEGPQQVWAIHNADGSVTVALFNLADAPATVTANWSDLGLHHPATVQNVWSGAILGRFTDHYSTLVAPHGARLLRLH